MSIQSKTNSKSKSALTLKLAKYLEEERLKPMACLTMKFFYLLAMEASCFIDLPLLQLTFTKTHI